MVQPIRWLDDLEMKGGAINAECQHCGRVAYFEIAEMLRYFRRRHWDRSWPGFAVKLRCRPPLGCGARGPEVTWVPNSPPRGDDPVPPRPTFARQSVTPIGAAQVEHVGRRLRVVKRRKAA